ncbi:MAG TPA: glycosyltransferase family 9 protein, partial [Casimicrobiaceae bacterium]
MAERILIVAPSWVGDAILSEPLVAVLREPLEEPLVDVLAPPWCAPIYARMRGIGRVIESPFGHRELAFRRRRMLARELRSCGYTRAFVLPNSFKAALIPWLARIPRRI